MTILYIIASLFFLNLIIFVHELFHLLAAKLLKIDTTEFAIGMGPSLFAIQKRNDKFYTKFFHKKEDDAIDPQQMSYHIRLIPLGGYVSFAKENNGVIEDGLNIHKPWKRIIVAAAGPIGNLVFAVFLMIFLLFIHQYHGQGIQITSILKPSFAQTLQLKPNDAIIKVNNHTVSDHSSLKSFLKVGEKNCITVLRNHATLTQCGIMPSSSHGLIGIQYNEKISLIKFIPASISMTYDLSVQYMKHFIQTIYGFHVKDFSGPIGIVNTMKDNVAHTQSFVEILILVNIALGLANLLFPFSITDGGRILLDLIAILVKKHKLSTKYLDYISVSLMAMLFILTTVMDIGRLFGWVK